MIVDVKLAQEIPPESWLNEPRFNWFREGHRYASTQTLSIPGLASIPPEDLYYVVCSFLRSMGHRPPDELVNSR